MKVSIKTIVISAASLAIISGGAVATSLYLNNQNHKMAETAAQSVKSADVSAPATNTASTPEVSETPTPVTVETQQPVQAPVEKPVILSTQEYAQKYLDMSVPNAQMCLDRIVQVWPSRFTEDVREYNIKALRAWANICSTGVLNFTVDGYFREGIITLRGSLIGSYGDNGEWFDTQLARLAAEK